MKEQFLRENCVPFKIAKSLKEAGFDEECIAIWHNDKLHLVFDFDSYANHGSLVTNTKSWTWQDCTAPLFQQVFDWFDKLGIFGRTEWEAIGSDEWVFTYTIEYLPKNAKNEKRRCSHVISIWASYEEGSGTYSGGWETDKEAKIACIEKMIEIYKERNN